MSARVKPDREAVARALYADDFARGRVGEDWDDLTQETRDWYLHQADAVLDLLPGRSEAEVKAEALRGFATAALAQFAAYGNGPEDTITVTPAFIAGIAVRLVDRLAAEGGADR